VGEISDEQFQTMYGAWAPRDERDAAALLAGFGGDWWLAGGRAIEAWTGVAREHEDVDVSILRGDLPALRRHLAEVVEPARRRHVWAAFGGALKPLWPDDPDEVPEGCGQVWLRRDAFSPWEFDVLLNPGERGQWVNRRHHEMSATLDEATWRGDGARGVAGVRYLQPEIVLLFKAKHLRAKDRADFEAALPLLDGGRREWLRRALERVHPGHEWLARLT
jgi:hypothetical protein